MECNHSKHSELKLIVASIKINIFINRLRAELILALNSYSLKNTVMLGNSMNNL